MFQPLQTGRLGMTAQQRNIDVLGNNIANLSTTGYKKGRLDFQDNLYTRMFNKEDMGVHMNLQRGVGTRTYQTARIFEQGVLESTERPLDFALRGRGFFVLENPNPVDEDGLDEFFFTRSGTFYLSVEEGGEETYLVDSLGRYLLDENGGRIMVANPDTLRCDETGLLYAEDEYGNVTEIARLGLTDFINPAGLLAVGDSAFVQTENSGDMLNAAPEVRQGFTEGSNVDLAEEMTRMIRAQRAYQIAARCVSTADQMMQVANAIRS